MKQKAALVISLSLIVFFVIANLPFANAHKPLNSENNNNFETATEIPDYKVSWAIYQQLGDNNKPNYYRFNANKGERFYMQMMIPDLKKYNEFAPSIAIVGKDMHDAKLDKLTNSIVSRVGVSELGLDLSRNADMEAIILDYNRSSSSDKFYEPFTQTSYLVRQELLINDLPSSGVYELVIFNAVQSDNEGRKFVLAVGETEDFSTIDFFTTLPAAWFQTKLFFEDYFSIIVVIMVILGVISLPVLLLIRSRKFRTKLRTIGSC